MLKSSETQRTDTGFGDVDGGLEPYADAAHVVWGVIDTIYSLVPATKRQEWRFCEMSRAGRPPGRHFCSTSRAGAPSKLKGETLSVWGPPGGTTGGEGV